LSEHKLKEIKNNIIISHHDINSPFFEYHVFIIKSHAVCIGCLAELVAAIVFIVIFLFFYPIIDFLLRNQLQWIFLVILSPQLNYFTYIYRFIKKDEFPYKSIKFISRFILTLGLIFNIMGIINYFYIFIGMLMIIILGLIFILIRKYSNMFLIKEYEKMKNSLIIMP